ncbi:hypothetical protein DL765_000113 [Monosporascus sp. GIB2]|nr:hypothetical protein DL765_000113 [Monosporascus sp. GIB2]
MAEVAGLVLGALGIAGLFKSCIDNFNVAVQAKSFSKDFEVLCAELSLHRIRLVFWGQSLGLHRAPDEPFHPALEHEEIRAAVQHALNALFLLLTEADELARRYAIKDERDDQILQTSKGMTIFRDSFDKFKDRISRHQKQKSTWRVIKWSVHDLNQFEGSVAKVRTLLDALEKTTSAARDVETPEALLAAEIDSITDPESLHLLQGVGSSAGSPPSLRAISDGASERLARITSSSQSFHTAPTWQPWTAKSNRQSDAVTRSMSLAIRSSTLDPVQECQETDQERDTDQSRLVSVVPQHQRWMTDLMSSHFKGPRPLGPSSRREEYGSWLSICKTYDSKHYRKNAANNDSLWRRTYHEVRNTQRVRVPFIHADTVGDHVDEIIASIEGPPGTPYEGGIFWITVKLIANKPPLLRFHTRIYHPNIDHTGKVCADYATSWKNHRQRKDHTREVYEGFYSSHYSLAALLIAVCGLLARPNIDNPLVPEIAATYITDYERYCEAARLYTEKFAHAKRPADKDLVFASDDDTTDIPQPQTPEVLLRSPRERSIETQSIARTADEADWGELDQVLVSKDFARSQLEIHYKSVKKWYWRNKAKIEQLTEQLPDLIKRSEMPPARQDMDTSTHELSKKLDRLFDAVDILSMQLEKGSDSLLPQMDDSTSEDGPSSKTPWPEVLAKGRAVVSRGIIEEIFNKCFHPSLDVDLSRQLKEIDIRTSAVMRWRSTTLEGLGDALGAAEGSRNRDSFAAQTTRNFMDHIFRQLWHRPSEKQIGTTISLIVEQAIDIAADIAELSLKHCHISLFYPQHGDRVDLETMNVIENRPSSLDPWELDDERTDDLNRPDPTPSEVIGLGGRYPYTVCFAETFAVMAGARQMITKARVWSMDSKHPNATT